MDKWIFTKFSEYVGHDINNLEDFGDDAFNPLNAVFIFVLHGSLLISNITE